MEKSTFLAKTGIIVFETVQNNYSGLYNTFCENLNNTSTVDFALVLGLQTVINSTFEQVVNFIRVYPENTCYSALWWNELFEEFQLLSLNFVTAHAHIQNILQKTIDQKREL